MRQRPWVWGIEGLRVALHWPLRVLASLDSPSAPTSSSGAGYPWTPSGALHLRVRGHFAIVRGWIGAAKVAARTTS